MLLTPICIDLGKYPDEIVEFLSCANLYDSSSSPSARVIYSDKDEGYFIKQAAMGELYGEYVMTDYFAEKGLSAQAVAYISQDKDYLITKKIKGEDCINPKYLENPKKLCDTLAENIFNLHNTDFTHCPVKNHSQKYLERAVNNYNSGNYDKTKYTDCIAQNAVAQIKSRGNTLSDEVLIHGDCCLPNIILDNWKLSGYIDLGYAGVGDRHIDVYWAVRSLQYNLKTDKYNKRFIDAYGRKYIDKDKLKLIDAIEILG